MALRLPPEVKHLIALSCSPSTLASLSLIHSSYLVEVEPILYQGVYFYLNPKDPSSFLVLTTLKDNQRKSDMVCSLTVSFPTRPNVWNSNDETCKAASSLLCDALCTLRSLVDLRLYMQWRDIALADRLQTVLSGDFFKLKTLHCSSSLDFPAFLPSQMYSLRTIGLQRVYGYEPNVMSTISYISETLKSPAPAVFGFECDTYYPTWNVMDVFPVFFQQFSWKTIRHSYDTDQAEPTKLSVEEVTWVRLYLDGKVVNDQSYLRELLTEVWESFPEVITLEFYFRSIQMNRTIDQEMSDLISSVFRREVDLSVDTW